MMNRTYDRDWYLNKVMDIKNVLGNECGISSDFIAGFCSETEKEHQDTLSLMNKVIYDYSYMFYYSERPGTLAQRKYDDDITLETKKRRLSEIISKQKKHSLERNNLSIGNRYKVLIEGNSRKSNDSSLTPIRSNDGCLEVVDSVIIESYFDNNAKLPKI